MVALLAFDFVMKLVSKAEMAAVSGVEGLGSLHAWLGQELETRGIDAVIYTRYILSILQQDSFVADDLDLAADNHFFPPNRKEGQRGRSTFRNSRKSEKRRPVEIGDCEERKKSAAVECLLSLSDEDSGIENLVEEIYSKLKEQQANNAESSECPIQPDAAASSDSDSSDPAAGPAERYYAAFPALSTETEGSVAPSLASKGGVWAAKVTQGLARSDSARPLAMTRVASTDAGEEKEDFHEETGTHSSEEKDEEQQHNQHQYHSSTMCPFSVRFYDGESGKEYGNHTGKDHQGKYASSPVNRAEGDVQQSKSSKYSKMPIRNSKAWKDYEYMKPIFIIPKASSSDVNMQRVRSVRTNQKTESVLDFFFKSRVALASPLLDEICYCGAESVWRCTSGCLSWPEMLGLGADSEDQSWYTEPLDMMVRPSPLPSRRLYNRRSVFSTLTNWALYENTFSYEDEENGLEALGLTSLLSRTLNEYGSNEKSMENNIFLPRDLEDSTNEENDTISSETVSEVSSEIYQITLEGEGLNQRGSSEEKEERVGHESDEEEVAYPSHISLNSIEKAKPVEGICIQPPSLAHDEEEEVEERQGVDKGEFSSGNMSLLGSPESQVPWETPELTELLSQERSIPDSSPIQTSLVEALWDIPSGQRSSFSEDGKSEEPVIHQDIESLWDCSQLSPALGDNNEVFLSVDEEDKKWGHSSSSSPPSKLECHPSFQVRHLIDEAIEEREDTREIPKTGIHNLAPNLKGAFGLGNGVWESSPLSPCATQGRLSTPSSSENEVLDDRPYIHISLDNHYHLLEKDTEHDSPIPIPPIEFNFSDSEEDDDDGHHLNHHFTHVAHHPVYHTSLSPHLHHSSPSFNLPHSHSHSCIENIDHLDIWKDHDATTRGTNETDGAPLRGKKEEEEGGHREMVGGEEHRGIMASLTCDTYEPGPRWSQCSPLTDMLLTTSLPMFLDNSNIWSYCLEKVFPPKVDKSPIEGDWPDRYRIRDPWAAITLPLSPIHGGSDLSHLWDINAVHKSDWKPDTGTIGMETQNIRRYLMNLRFEIPRPESRSKILDGGLYGTLVGSGSWTVKEHNSPSWSMWKCCSPQLQSLASSDVVNSVPLPESRYQESDKDGAKLWHNFSAKPRFFRQRSTSADNADLVMSGAEAPFYHRASLLGSTDLLPSENSAFCDKIPPRLPHLPHVQSEPSLSLERLHRGNVYNHGRLVQVRSLYKSDASILHQLGLASGHSEQPSSEIQVQPHTHFVPISSDNSLKGSSVTTTDPTKGGAGNNESQYIPTPSGPVPKVCPVLGRDSSYQLYYNEEDEDEAPSSPDAFVPRFQVQKHTEKWCQTGERSSNNSPNHLKDSDVQEDEESAFREDSVGTLDSLIPKYIVPSDDNSDALEIIEELPSLDLDELIDEEAEIPEEVDGLEDVAGAEGGEICNLLQVEESKESKDQETLGMFLYDMQDVLELSAEDAERFINGDADPGVENELEKEDVEISSDYESMGGEQVSVEELGRSGIAELWEGEDDEDSMVTPVPIMAPAPSPSIPIATGSGGATSGNFRSIWSWGTEPELPSIPDNFSSTPHTSFVGSESGLPFDGSLSGHIPWSCADADISGLHLIGDDHLNDQFAIGEDTEPTPEWLDDNDVFIDDPDVQMQLIGVDPNPEPDKLLFSSDLEEHWLNAETSFTVQVPMKRHVTDRKKPCSFFLEGNCRRTDCKYAHDISNITCRFWEEGDCFKGVTCPFLHGYAAGIRHEHFERSSSEKDFSLEEEEFPELSNSQEETGSYMKSAGPRNRTSSKRFEDRPPRSGVEQSERNLKGDSERRSKKSGSSGNRLSLKAIGNKLKANAEKKTTKKPPKD